MLDIFENFRVLAYADDLKLYIVSAGLGLGLQSWCHGKKYDLNAGKCKSISFSRGSNLVMFQYVIIDIDLEQIDEINDLGLLIDRRMTFVNHIESIVSKSASLNVGIYKANKALYVAFVRIVRVVEN
jgi:hypothetical protein